MLSIPSCCKDMVSIRTRKKLATSDPDAEHELQQLEKIKVKKKKNYPVFILPKVVIVS